MKKLAGIIVCGMLVLGCVGCSSETAVEEDVKEETKVEERVEKKEETVEENPEVITIENDKDFKHYLTSSLSDDEYAEYFDTLFTMDEDLPVVEFDATIVCMDLREGYNTRYELLLYPGDNNGNEVTGPSIKIKDAASTMVAMYEEGAKVRVTGTIWGYDREQCYVDFHVDDVKPR